MIIDDEEPDLLVLLGEAHLLVHVQVQHVLREQVNLKAKICQKMKFCKKRFPEIISLKMMQHIMGLHRICESPVIFNV